MYLLPLQDCILGGDPSLELEGGYRARFIVLVVQAKRASSDVEAS